MKVKKKKKKKKPWTQMGGENNTGSGKVTAALQGNLLKGEAQGEDHTPVISDLSAHTVMHTNTHTHTHCQPAAWRKAWCYMNHRSTKENIIPWYCIKNLHVQPFFLSFFLFNPVLRQKETSSFNTFAGTFPTFVELDFPGSEQTLWHDHDAVEKSWPI